MMSGGGKLRTGPGFREFELDEPSNALKVPVVVRHEHTPRLTARQGQENVVGERLRDPRDFQPFLSRHFREDIPGSMPCLH